MTTTKKVGFKPELASGVEALEMVLRKFNKKKEGTVLNFSADDDGDSDTLEVDGWGVYVRSDKGEKRLTDSELLDICHGKVASRFDVAAVRENGLLLRKVSSRKKKDIEEFMGGPGRAYTSTGAKRSIKWIKGALIGAGSFGSVYLGMDSQSGLLMAVKQVELPSSSGDIRNEERRRNMVQALEREIDILKELQHENIVTYLDSATDNDRHLNIFLEYVPGGSVAALLNNYGAFEEALVRNFSRQILTGLNYLHERGIIHRDIKGANILVDNKGGIKISDFGISKKAENNLMGIRGNRPSLQGSVFWMAPEAMRQTIYTSKADIWSVGCLVVEMLTGTHPWAELSQMQAIYKFQGESRWIAPRRPSKPLQLPGKLLCHQAWD
ncbi:ATP binding [Vanrija albida]|uniref:ATP binding n=1 Tax=Vanrija albida TaxID=181172 RepID=A0ABR3Q111_9TREE